MTKLWGQLALVSGNISIGNHEAMHIYQEKADLSPFFQINKKKAFSLKYLDPSMKRL